MTSFVVGTDFTDATRLPSYANGRLLLAEDLTAGQATLVRRDTRIGEAAGAGVVRGLWVTGTTTTLTVDAGLAIAASGSPVVVAQRVTLSLTTTSVAAAVQRPGFGCCDDGPATTTDSALTEGVLVLTARPACRSEGSLPTGPAPSGASSGCVARWQLEGVEFRAVPLPVGPIVAAAQVTAGNRRNLVAHWCYGTEQLGSFAAYPFTFDPAYGGLDALGEEDLDDCDVPLAVFAWDGKAVSDLDNWAVRRRVTTTSPVTSPWQVVVSDRRYSEGEARFLQFQDQAHEIVAQAKAQSARAQDYFGYLPPVGFLPISNLDLRELASVMAERMEVRMEVRREERGEERMEVHGEEATEGGSGGTRLGHLLLIERWFERRKLREVSSDEGDLLEASKVITEGADEAVEDHAGRHAPAAAEDRAEAGRVPKVAKELSGDELDGDRLFVKALLDVAETSPGYGFDPATFFGGLAQLGGILDWDLVDFALRESWRASPVLVTDPAALKKDRRDDGRDDGRDNGSPITYYYVLQNLAARQTPFVYGSAVDRLKARAMARRAAADNPYLRGNLYVVFMADQKWIGRTVPPFTSVPLYATFGDVV